jgi:hypothetical protein
MPNVKVQNTNDKKSNRPYTELKERQYSRDSSGTVSVDKRGVALYDLI